MLAAIFISTLAVGTVAFPATSLVTKRQDDYQTTALYHHNVHRANHSASDLTWSDSLTQSASDLASQCNFAHNTDIDGGGYGQNLAAGFDADDIHMISDVWYNGEVNSYGNQYGSDPDFSGFENWGHFTQVVWLATTQVGCATQDCSASGLEGVDSDVPPYLTVCNYQSPGNYESPAGEFAANVLAPLGQPTVS